MTNRIQEPNGGGGGRQEAPWDPLEKLKARARQALLCYPERAPRPAAELGPIYKRFLKMEQHRLRFLHNGGAGGFEVCRRRSALCDLVLENLFKESFSRLHPGRDFMDCPAQLVALGGYGRGLLNPGSDIDLLFLLAAPARRLPAETKQMIEQIIPLLWDAGLKVSHTVWDVKEAAQRSLADDRTLTSLLEARLIVGRTATFEGLQEMFERQCLKGRQRENLERRRQDLDQRRGKHRTVFLQEPNVKRGCGGLRDYHNLIWLAHLQFGTNNLEAFLGAGILSAADLREVERAHDLLLRVRNGLHFATRPPTDILTLRLQGVLATQFGYPQANILRRCEEFMRDYYRHTRQLYLHLGKVMERLKIAQLEEDDRGLMSFLARRRRPRESFDGFESWQGRLYAQGKDLFREDPVRIMRAFRHAQQRELALSPDLTELIRESYPLINRAFRYDRKVFHVFEAILSRPGEVYRTLKQMHRVGVLGRYLPEFGALTCLVQHEFFHRYTADYHTLLCTAKLDELAGSDRTDVVFFQEMFRSIEDPFVLYLALLLHDTGRAENVRLHSDASAILASRVCRRLQIRGERRRLLLFLVDHHLTFWRTATTKNVDDPETVTEFAGVVRNKRYLDALYLFTLVDSRATNEEAWSDWKAQLMQQLYTSTLLYWEKGESFRLEARQPDETMREGMLRKLGESYREEVEAHLRLMPPRYFPFRKVGQAALHVQMAHDFMACCLEQAGDPLAVVLHWLKREGGGYSELTVVTWDRPFLVARVAGALAAHGINILSADIFSRDDDIAVDVFRVCTTDFMPVTAASTQRSIRRMLEQALAAERFDFRPLIEKACTRAALSAREAGEFPQRVHLDNRADRRTTLVEVQAVDRLGLLYDLLEIVDKLDLELVSSRISTENGAALDSLWVVRRLGGKVVEPAEQENLLRQLERALANPAGKA
ncbi:MAG TPA: [protein-PII] uridylyltransferase [Verrucomicrobiales bacterium]|nr:[protein-PII] uridylyltransferase [Verrucomicrobiales bacterium]